MLDFNFSYAGIGVPIKKKIECTRHPEENDGKGIKLKSCTGSKGYLYQKCNDKKQQKAAKYRKGIIISVTQALLYRTYMTMESKAIFLFKIFPIAFRYKLFQLAPQ